MLQEVNVKFDSHNDPMNSLPFLDNPALLLMAVLGEKSDNKANRAKSWNKREKMIKGPY